MISEDSESEEKPSSSSSSSAIISTTTTGGSCSDPGPSTVDVNTSDTGDQEDQVEEVAKSSTCSVRSSVSVASSTSSSYEDSDHVSFYATNDETIVDDDVLDDDCITVADEDVPIDNATVEEESQIISFPINLSKVLDVTQETVPEEDVAQEELSAVTENDGVVVEEMLLDVITQEAGIVSDADTVFQNDVLIIMFNIERGLETHFFAQGIADKPPRWISFPRIERVKADDIGMITSLSEELALEFTKRHFNKDIVILYKTDASRARHELDKELLVKIKQQFKMNNIRKLYPPDPPKPRKVKVTKVKLPKIEKVKIPKPPKPKKIKVPKPKKIPRIRANRKMRNFIKRLVLNCVSSAVKQSKAKKKQVKAKRQSRRLQERDMPPIMEIAIDPADYYSQPQTREPRARRDPNEGFDLHWNGDIPEQRSNHVVPLTFADFIKKSRKTKEDKLPDLKLQSEEDFINLDKLIWPEAGLDELEEDEIAEDELDEDYKYKEDFTDNIARATRKRTRSVSDQGSMTGRSGVEGDWTNTRMFTSSFSNILPPDTTEEAPINNLKRIRFDEGTGGYFYRKFEFFPT